MDIAIEIIYLVTRNRDSDSSLSTTHFNRSVTKHEVPIGSSRPLCFGRGNLSKPTARGLQAIFCFSDRNLSCRLLGQIGSGSTFGKLVGYLANQAVSINGYHPLLGALGETSFESNESDF